MSNEIVVSSSSNGGALSVVELKQRVNMVQQAMGSVMRKGAHYGEIPGCQKPSLFKPGSELLLSMFRIAVIPRVDDMSMGGEIRYRVTCQGQLPDGTIVGEGVGECSSEEEKYKWRSAVCDAEFEDTPDDRRRKKYTRDGKSYKQVRMNPADVANTILKMAKKRAQMDLTLTCTGASDVFTQDVEDLPQEYINQQKGSAAKPQSRPAPPKPAAKPAAAAKEEPKQDELQEGADSGGDGEMTLAEQIDIALDILTDGTEGGKRNLLMEASRSGKTSGPFLVYTKLHNPETSQPWLQKIYEYLEPMLPKNGDEDVPC